MPLHFATKVTLDRDWRRSRRGGLEGARRGRACAEGYMRG
jgi:hypothetical protein